MSTSIYVVSRYGDYTKYKIGHHTGTLKQLYSRYVTSTPDLTVNCFIETPFAQSIENILKNYYREYRIPTHEGKLSEWFILPLALILQVIQTCVITYSDFSQEQVLRLTTEWLSALNIQEGEIRQLSLTDNVLHVTEHVHK